MHAPSWTATAPQTGPWALCGATTARWASAIDASWRVRQMPPRWSGSGWRMWTTSCDSRSANWPSEVKLSPVAIGTGERRATSTIEPSCEWWTGSSSQAGRNSARRSAMRSAVEPVKRLCASIIRSTSGPTASRTARTMSIERSSSRRSWTRQAVPNGSNFIAV